MFMYAINSRNIVYLRKCSGYKWHITEESLSSGFSYIQTKKLFEMYNQLFNEIMKKMLIRNYFLIKK